MTTSADKVVVSLCEDDVGELRGPAAKRRRSSDEQADVGRRRLQGIDLSGHSDEENGMVLRRGGHRERASCVEAVFDLTTSPDRAKHATMTAAGAPPPLFGQLADESPLTSGLGSRRSATLLGPSLRRPRDQPLHPRFAAFVREHQPAGASTAAGRVGEPSAGQLPCFDAWRAAAADAAAASPRAGRQPGATVGGDRATWPTGAGAPPVEALDLTGPELQPALQPPLSWGRLRALRRPVPPAARSGGSSASSGGSPPHAYGLDDDATAQQHPAHFSSAGGAAPAERTYYNAAAMSRARSAVRQGCASTTAAAAGMAPLPLMPSSSAGCTAPAAAAAAAPSLRSGLDGGSSALSRRFAADRAHYSSALADFRRAGLDYGRDGAASASAAAASASAAFADLDDDAQLAARLQAEEDARLARRTQEALEQEQDREEDERHARMMARMARLQAMEEAMGSGRGGGAGLHDPFGAHPAAGGYRRGMRTSRRGGGAGGNPGGSSAGGWGGLSAFLPAAMPSSMLHALMEMAPSWMADGGGIGGSGGERYGGGGSGGAGYYGGGGGGGGGGFHHRDAMRQVLANIAGSRLPPHVLLSDRDFTADDYEWLCRLDETVENRKGASAAAIDALPTQVVGAGGLKDEAGEPLTCLICLEALSEGCMLRALPCAHRFHQPCLDHWLRQKAVCPVCQRQLK